MSSDIPPLPVAYFRALASPTRAAILRVLGERAHTPAELARRLGVRDSTVAGHLDRLRKAGLVSRREDGRVWAYHELTPAGRHLVSTRSWAPGVGGVSAVALALGGGWLLREWLARRPAPPPPPPPVRPLIAPANPPVPADPAPAWWLPTSVALLVLATVLLLACLYAWWWHRAARAGKATAAPRDGASGRAKATDNPMDRARVRRP